MRNRLWFLVAYFSVGLFCIHTEIVIKEMTVCRMWSIVIHNWFAVICSLWHLMCGRSLNDMRSLMSNLQPFRIDLWLLWRSAFIQADWELQRYHSTLFMVWMPCAISGCLDLFLLEPSIETGLSTSWIGCHCQAYVSICVEQAWLLKCRVSQPTKVNYCFTATHTECRYKLKVWGHKIMWHLLCSIYTGLYMIWDNTINYIYVHPKADKQPA